MIKIKEKEKNKDKLDHYMLVNNLIRIILLISISPLLMADEYNKVLYIIITLALTFYDFLVKKILKINLSNTLKYSILFLIVTTEFLGSTLDFYGKFYWWDTFVHGISGTINFFIGFEFINKFNERLSRPEIHPAIQVIFAICFSIAILGLWEIAEFIIDEVTGLNMQITQGLVGQDAIWDTIEDMISATIGTIVGTIIQCFKLRKKEN